MLETRNIKLDQLLPIVHDRREKSAVNARKPLVHLLKSCNMQKTNNIYAKRRTAGRLHE